MHSNWMAGELNLSSLSGKTRTLDFTEWSCYCSETYMVVMHWERKVLVINSEFSQSLHASFY